jgi:uncharacterized protein YaiI (UPF0178 family)
VLPHIYIDADACPVKQEVFRVAERYKLAVTLVANSWMRIPESVSLNLVVVNDSLDAADDWIVEHVIENDIVITADIPLAARCIKKGSLVLGTTGKPFTDDNIGQALATRELLSELREAGTITGGPAQFQPKDRSRFLQQLDLMIQKILRNSQ